MSVFERSSFVVVGHRGGRGDTWPTENTFAAFERAFDERADAIELDVRLCATGEVVVFHDPKVNDVEIQRIPYLEMATKYGAPVLRDVAVFCNDRRKGLNVEVKYDFVDQGRLVRGVIRTLDEFPDLDVIISSFDPRILARIRAARPRLRLAMLTTTERRWSLPLARTLAARRLVFAVHLERAHAKPEIVRAIHSRVRVGVWTVNDPTEARALRDAGADWVITDSPAIIRAGLA